MPGNTSNTSNTNRNVHPLRVIQVAGAVSMAAFEMFVLAEILWYYLHDGEQTLHGAIGKYLDGLRDRVAYRTAVEDTREQIRDLPETP